MGNTKSTKLKELYSKGKSEILQTENEKLIGAFKVIKFEGFKDDLFILKVLDPRLYDQYADISEFVKKMSMPNPNICDFIFIGQNAANKELYDLVFEYGPAIESAVASEKDLWNYMTQISDALVFMEENKFHYPILAKRYIIKGPKEKIRLMNPYCFPDYIKEILQIYLNPQNPISSRNRYHKLQILRNVKEFGILILTLITNANEYQLKTDQNYVGKTIDSLALKFSKNLLELLKLILLNANSPKTLKDLRSAVYSSKPGVINDASKIFNIFRGNTKEPGIQQQSAIQVPSLEKEKVSLPEGPKTLEALPKPAEKGPEEKKEKRDSKETLAQGNKQNVKIFGNKKQADLLKNRSVTPTPVKTDMNSSKTETGNAKKTEINPKNKAEDKTAANSKVKFDPQTSKGQVKTDQNQAKKMAESLENFQTFGPKKEAEKKANQAQTNNSKASENKPKEKEKEVDERNFQTEPNDAGKLAPVKSTLNPSLNMSKEEFFSSKQTLLDEKRSSINNVPLFNENTRLNFEFVNGGQTDNKNINMYLKTHDKNIQEQLINSLNLFDFEINSNPYFENPGKLFKKQNSEDKEKREQGKNTKGPSLPPIESSKLSSSKDSEQPDQTPVLQSDAFFDSKPAEQKSQNKPIKRVILKWNVDQNRHVKFNEYEDGTQEEVKEEGQGPKSAKELSSQPNQNINTANTQQKSQQSSSEPEDKPTHVLNYEINKNSPVVQPNTFEAKEASNMHFILIPSTDQPAFLLFRSNVCNPSKKFSDLANVVNKNHPACPSVYHNVEEEKKPKVYSSELKEKDRSLTPNKQKKEAPISAPSHGPGINTRTNLPTSLSNQNTKVIRKN